MVNDNAGGFDDNTNNEERQQEPEGEFKEQLPVEKRPDHESSAKDVTSDSRSQQVQYFSI
jgi:hypothetical protein